MPILVHVPGNMRLSVLYLINAYQFLDRLIFHDLLVPLLGRGEDVLLLKPLPDPELPLVRMVAVDVLDVQEVNMECSCVLS